MVNCRAQVPATTPAAAGMVYSHASVRLLAHDVECQLREPHLAGRADRIDLAAGTEAGEEPAGVLGADPNDGNVLGQAATLRLEAGCPHADSALAADRGRKEACAAARRPAGRGSTLGCLAAGRVGAGSYGDVLRCGLSWHERGRLREGGSRPYVRALCSAREYDDQGQQEKHRGRGGGPPETMPRTGVRAVTSEERLVLVVLVFFQLPSSAHES